MRRKEEREGNVKNPLSTTNRIIFFPFHVKINCFTPCLCHLQANPVLTILSLILCPYKWRRVVPSYQTPVEIKSGHYELSVLNQ